MWKNYTAPYLKPLLCQDTKQQSYISPKSMKLSQHDFGKLCYKDDKIMYKSALGTSNQMNKMQEIKKIQDNQKLRIDLFKAGKALQQIKSQSKNIKQRLKQIFLKQKLTKSNSQVLHSPNKNLQQNKWKQILNLVINSTDKYLKDVLVVCEEYQQRIKIDEIKQKNYQNSLKKGTKLYNKILIACQDKLKSAEMLLKQMRIKMQQKEATIKKLASENSDITIQIQRLQAQNKKLIKSVNLYESDQKVYKAEIERKNGQIQQMRKQLSLQFQKYDNLMAEYERLSTKCQWFQNMYQEKRCRVSQLQNQKLRIYQQHSLKTQSLCKQIQNLQQEAAQSYNKSNIHLQLNKLYKQKQIQNTGYQLQLEQYRNNNYNLIEDNKRLRQTIQKIEQRIGDTLRQMQQMQARVTYMRQNLTMKQRIIEQNRGIIKQMEQENERLKIAYREAQQNIQIIAQELQNKQQQIDEIVTRQNTHKIQIGHQPLNQQKSKQNKLKKSKVNKFNLITFQSKNSIIRAPFKPTNYW